MAEKTSTIFANEQLAAMRTAFANGVLAIYSGSQPASADAAETGTLLCLITNNGQPFTAGNAANGLNFDEPSGGRMDIASGETWSGTALESGVAGWFRFYDNAYVTGASTTARRFDGAISTSNTAELQMADPTMTAGDTQTVDSLPIIYPV